MKKKVHTKKRAVTAQKIFLYCPADKVDYLYRETKDYNFEVVINDYSLKNFSTEVICYYESPSLDKKEKEFLITATEYGAWVEPLVSYLDRRFGYTHVKLLSSDYFLHQKAFTILTSRKTQLAKRFVDISSACILLFFALPIGLITALLIKLETSGPIFYKQKRVGLYNKEYEVYKFRSMSQDAEKEGAKWASKNDARVTKVGKFIRSTRIDELPQIINILKGEMSIVGPRPEREVFIKELESVIPYYRFRHAVKPGVTGLAQVNYQYGASIEDAIWKHKYDIYYIKHHGALKDLKILLKTIKVVVFGMGR